MFGHPVVVPCEGCTNRDLYAEVWRQVERLLSKDSRLTQKYWVWVRDSGMMSLNCSYVAALVKWMH